MSAQSDMSASAKDFIRAGGVLDWDTWAGMSGDTRVAFIDAGSELEAERAGRIVVALATAYSDVMDVKSVEDRLDAAEARIAAQGIG